MYLILYILYIYNIVYLFITWHSALPCRLCHLYFSLSSDSASVFSILPLTLYPITNLLSLICLCLISPIHNAIFQLGLKKFPTQPPSQGVVSFLLFKSLFFLSRYPDLSLKLKGCNPYIYFLNLLMVFFQSTDPEIQQLSKSLPLPHMAYANTSLISSISEISFSSPPTILTRIKFYIIMK